MRKASDPFSLVRNWISLIGILLSMVGFVLGITFIAMGMRGHFPTPYVGIFAYMVLPAFLIIGLPLISVGVWRERKRRRAGDAGGSRLPVLDLSNRRQFLAFNIVVFVTLAFITLSAVGAYQAYHFTESVSFCGETCHSVMKPEHVAYLNSPHANAGCTTCHIGPGAGFFVKSKLNGLYQVYSTIFDKHSRPIATPIHNLRPAQETCYTCHWPEKFFGAIEVQRTYFRADEENTPWSIRMLMKVGGGDGKHGRGQGIHWHMSINSKVEYIAADERRLEIPWVRLTKKSGETVVFQSRDESKRLTDTQIAEGQKRTMDCLDCHNRPAHQFHSPERALNETMAAGHIDATLPFIKANAVAALTGNYESETQALHEIRTALLANYPDGGASVEQAIAAVQNVYKQNFFPEMKVDWRAYPDHIGHHTSAGCFRCHDGQLADPEGNTISRDCNGCHTIISQGPGRELLPISSGGLEFEHPEDIDEEWKETRCSDCHEGVPVM